MKLVDLKNLYKKYGTGLVVALDGVNLQIDQGELFGLVGPNGAGKTTLIEILAGIRKQDSGEVFLWDQEVKSGSFAHRQQIGFVLERPLYFDRLTCREFLKFSGRMYDVQKGELKKRVEELLDFFDLSEAGDRLIETYSKGMRQKVSLAAAIIHEPRLLILDEPLDGIDPGSSQAIKQILMRMTEKGVTVLVTSHVLEMVEDLCTECAIIHEGKIVFQSRVDELESRVREIGDEKTIGSLREVFLKITSSTHRTKTLSWL